LHCILTAIAAAIKILTLLYEEVKFKYSPAAMCLKDGNLFIVTKEILRYPNAVNGGVMGADYLACVTMSGRLLFELRIKAADGFSVLNQIEATDSGFLIAGTNSVVAVNNEGKVIKRLELEHLEYANTVKYNDSYFVYGNGTGPYEGSIVYYELTAR
jgi:hypothetical protein